MKPATHLDIDHRLCGVPSQLGTGQATVVLHTHPDMVVDAQGLVHGGFLFGAADHAAMLAVNDPNVVLGASACRFLAPVRVGQRVTFRARTSSTKGRKHIVEVDGRIDDQTVFQGTFTTFVLDRHVLERHAGG